MWRRPPIEKECAHSACCMLHTFRLPLSSSVIATCVCIEVSCYNTTIPSAKILYAIFHPFNCIVSSLQIAISICRETFYKA